MPDPESATNAAPADPGRPPGADAGSAASSAHADPPPTTDRDEPDESLFPQMTLGEHLGELRWRLIISIAAIVLCGAVALTFGRPIFLFLVQPLVIALNDAGLPPVLLQLSPVEFVMVYLKTCLMVGLIAAAPIVLWQVWAFIGSGLYPHEKRYVRLFTPMSLVLFTVGVLFFYYVVLPVMLLFLVQFSRTLQLPPGLLGELALPADVQPVGVDDVPPIPMLAETPPSEEWRVGQWWFDLRGRMLRFVGPSAADGSPTLYSVPVTQMEQQNLVSPLFQLSQYTGFVTRFGLTFGLIFQLPIAVIFLMLTDIVSGETLRRGRRVIIFVMFALAAIITPTVDPVGMTLMALPMVLLFELGIVMGSVLKRRHDAQQAARDAELAEREAIREQQAEEEEARDAAEYRAYLDERRKNQPADEDESKPTDDDREHRNG